MAPPSSSLTQKGSKDYAPERGNRKGPFSSEEERFLLPLLPYSQKFGGVEAYLRPQEIKQIPQESNIQDGHTLRHPATPEQRQLHDFIGSRRRVFSCPYTSKAQKIPPVHRGWYPLSVLSPSIWLQIGSTDFHEVSGSCGSSLAEQRSSSIPVLRRLAAEGPVSSSSKGCNRRLSRPIPQTGILNKLPKIIYHPKPDNDISGSQLEHHSEQSLPLPGKTATVANVGTQTFQKKVRFCEKVQVSAGNALFRN